MILLMHFPGNCLGNSTPNLFFMPGRQRRKGLKQRTEKNFIIIQSIEPVWEYTIEVVSGHVVKIKVCHSILLKKGSQREENHNSYKKYILHDFTLSHFTRRFGNSDISREPEAH